jgi:hypothetical protein
VTPTRWTTLLAAAALAGVVTYAAFRAFYSSLPPLPPTAAWSTALLAVAEAFAAPSVRARLAGRPRTKPILPLVVARTAALAKASSMLGALLAGVWGGVLAYVLPRRDMAIPREDARDAALGLVSALLLVAAALWLESVCRVKNPPEADPPPGEPGP